MRSLNLLPVAAVAAVVTLSGCGALPQRPVVEERLDRTTGTTVRVVGSPCRFVTETRSKMLDQIEFLDLVPFQTNRAGRHDYYVAVIAWRTLAAGIAPQPSVGEWTVAVRGGTVPLRGPLTSPGAAGLGTWPTNPDARPEEIQVFPLELSRLREWLPYSGATVTPMDGPGDSPGFEALTNCEPNLEALLAAAD